jgi:predicted small secreted protein
MQRKLWLLSLLLTGSLALMAGQTETGKSAGQDLKDAGKNTTDAVKKGTKKTGHGIKKGANKTAGAAEKGAGKVKDKTSSTSTQ